MPYKVTNKGDVEKKLVIVDKIDLDLHNHVSGQPFSDDAIVSLQEEKAFVTKK